MNINTKIVLSSAESIIRERSSNKSTSSNPQITQIPLKEDETVINKNATLLKLYDSLNKLQNNLSREQFRYSIFEEGTINNAKDLVYDNQKLFPELSDEDFKTVDTRVFMDNIIESISNILNEIKSVEIKIENFYAAHFATPIMKNQDIALTPEISQKLHTLQPSRVMKLMNELS